MKAFKKRGDEGETDLLYGGRIPKSSPRTEAYGTIDEAVSALGIARALCEDEATRRLLLGVQRELFLVGAEMATEPAEYSKLVDHFGKVSSAMVEDIEKAIEAYEHTVEMPNGFVVPGGNLRAAHLDLSRAIVRRAERRAVGLWQERMLANDQVLHYLNRLADLLFVLARAQERGSTTLLKEAPPQGPI